MVTGVNQGRTSTHGEWNNNSPGKVIKHMANNPAEIQQNITDITNAWTELAPTATFAGLTLAQYKAAVKPSVDARSTITSLDEQMDSAIVTRDKVDVNTEKTNKLVIKSVVGDVNYGDDSALYEKMGYVRSSQRKTGLTRKNKKNGDGAKPK
jgi:hypothetical protein